jgi:predicted AAA+ superfamily ATPase
MIKREHLVREVRLALKRSRAVALIGPRQCGKTTLARQLVSAESPNYLDLKTRQASHAWTSHDCFAAWKAW